MGPGGAYPDDWAEYPAVDVGRGPEPLHAFVMALSHSRKPAVVWSRSEDQLHWLAAHLGVAEARRRRGLAGFRAGPCVAAAPARPNVRPWVTDFIARWTPIKPATRHLARILAANSSSLRRAPKRSRRVYTPTPVGFSACLRLCLAPGGDSMKRIALAAFLAALASSPSFAPDQVLGEPSVERPARSEMGSALEDGVWRELVIPGRIEHAAVYDPVRNRMIVFGGQSPGRYLKDVWTLSLSSGPAEWVALPTEDAPRGQYAHTALYDPVGDRIIVFGGYSGAQSNDVWALELSGTPSWSPLATIGTPPDEQVDHTSVYDSLRHRMLVFSRAAVWELTLSGTPTWSAITPQGVAPLTRVAHAAIYDPVRDRMLVFGGVSSNGAMNDVWQLTLAGTPTWTEIEPAGTPPRGRQDHTMVYDAERDRVLMYGGSDGTAFQDLWALNLAGDPTWTEVAQDGISPPARNHHVAIFDAQHDRMVVFGGGNNSYLNDTWAFDVLARNWTPLTSDVLPSERLDHSALYDPIRDRMIVFGGLTDGNVFLNDVFALSLSGVSTWTPITPAGAVPAARRLHSAIYDPVRDRMIIYGGNDGGVRNDTWVLTLSGTPTWTELLPLGGPPNVGMEHTAIYDPVRDRMIVFGGRDVVGTIRGDVWELSLSGAPTWTRLTPTGTLGARTLHSAIYDPNRDGMIVCGGYDGALHSDTWLLTLADSPGWLQLTGDVAPYSADHVAVYDATRNRMVIFGGALASATWALDLGSTPTWTELAPDGLRPVERGHHSAIYDPLRDRMVVFGGYSWAPLYNDVWALDWQDYSTSVAIRRFEADVAADRVTLRWEVGDLSSIKAFKVHRAVDESPTFQYVGMLPVGGGSEYYWQDRDLRPGTRYRYQLEVIRADGPSSWEGPVEIRIALFGPGLQLREPIPNPFRDLVELELESDSPHATRVCVFDLAGKRVVELWPDVDGERARVRWDGRDRRGRLVSPGVYLIRADLGETHALRRIVRVR